MCLGTFSRLRRSLATSTLYTAVCILAERFLLYRKAISCKVKKESIKYTFCLRTGVEGIEPSSGVLETLILPMNYTPIC